MTGPQVLKISGRDPDELALDLMAQHLNKGGVVAMPTETVYGFGCALQPAAIRRIQALKGRGADKPFLILAPSRESLPGLDWTSEARELAEVFWPGALTLILADRSGAYPAGVRSPTGSVAVRMSPHPVARGLVEALGAPITSTSANAPGHPPARSGDEARIAATGLGAEGEMWVVDVGELPPSPPSTIVDCTGPEPMVRRVGAIPLERLRCVTANLYGIDGP